jgi:polyisoprenoid-binding protein YceI
VTAGSGRADAQASSPRRACRAAVLALCATAASTMATVATATAAAPATASPAAPSSAAWSADPSRGSLTFRATQAGAEFEGRFTRFVARLEFLPGERPAGRFDVAIATASVSTADAERDDLLRSADFFDAARVPEARYLATTFVRVGADAYEARGRLTLRGVTREVPLRFTWTGTAAAPRLAGAAMLRRLEFGVGQGEWRDTAWVGDDVRIAFELRPVAASRPEPQ